MKYAEIHKKAVDEKRIGQVTPDYLEFKKVKDFVVGRFIGVASIKSTRGEGYYNQYLFHTDAGLVKFAIGSATDKEIAPLIRLGQVYHLLFQGKEKLKGGNSVNKFLVTHVEMTDEELDGLESPLVSSDVPAAGVGGSDDKAF